MLRVSPTRLFSQALVVARKVMLLQYSSIYRNCRRILQEDVTKSVTLAIADEHVGIVVGRSGRNIAEITQVSEEVHLLAYYAPL